jgi:hypothetical protein
MPSPDTLSGLTGPDQPQPELGQPEAGRPSADGLRDVRARLAKAARGAGRDPAAIELVAVSKQQPWEHVAPVLDAGQRVFGENRVQEAMARWSCA